MNDAVLLFAVLAALYVIRSAVWVDRHAVGFSPAPLRVPWKGSVHGSLRTRPAARTWGNRQHGLLCANLLPLPDPLALARPWPFSAAPGALYGFVSQTPYGADRPEQSGLLVEPRDHPRVTATDKAVLVDGTELACSDSRLFVRQMAALAERLVCTDERSREQVLAVSLHRAFDEQAVAARWIEYLRATRLVRGLSTALFFYLFLAAPLVVFTEGLELWWRELSAGLFLLLPATVVSFFTAHRHLYPEDSLGRWGGTFGLLLVPPEAARAADILARDALVGFHPLAVARGIGVDEEFIEMARGFLRDLAHPVRPVCPDPAPLAQETEQWYRDRLDAAARALIQRAKIDPDSLLAPPQRRGRDSQTYCPRCHVQFARRAASCSDCGGLETVAFEERGHTLG